VQLFDSSTSTLFAVVALEFGPLPISANFDWLVYLKKREKKYYERGNEVTGGVGGGVNETTAQKSGLFNTTYYSL
jgi:hypothetical protein